MYMYMTMLGAYVLSVQRKITIKRKTVVGKSLANLANPEQFASFTQPNLYHNTTGRQEIHCDK